jgi:hypothetical protein
MYRKYETINRIIALLCENIFKEVMVMNEQKQQQKLSAEARKVLAGFTALTENEKIQVLNKSGIWYLRHKGALVAPMLEARGILHALARLSWICQRVFLLAQSRKLELNMQLLEAVSENTVQTEVVNPVVNVINSHIKKLEQLIAEAKKEVKNG